MISLVNLQLNTVQLAIFLARMLGELTVALTNLMRLILLPCWPSLSHVANLVKSSYTDFPIIARKSLDLLMNNNQSQRKPFKTIDFNTSPSSSPRFDD